MNTEEMDWIKRELEAIEVCKKDLIGISMIKDDENDKKNVEYMRNKLEPLGKSWKGAIGIVKTTDEEYLLTNTPLALLSYIIPVDYTFELSSNIINWERTGNENGFSIHNKDSKNKVNLQINEEYLKLLDKYINLGGWEDQNKEILKLMIQNFTISDILQIDIWIRKLFEKTFYLNDRHEGIEYPVSPDDPRTIKEAVKDFFKNNNVSDSLNNSLGHLLVKYCLCHAFSI